MRERLVYIDWMKVIGMYFIIAGHMFSDGHDFLYTFSVPLFFLISGFLFRYETQQNIFWEKLFNNLVLPCLLICFIVLAVESIARLLLGKFDIQIVYHRILNIILGHQGKGLIGGGLGMCWFIYTLVICKIIQQLVHHSWLAKTIVLLVCFSIAFFYNRNGEFVYNSFMNVTLAYPFFLGGAFLSNYPEVNKSCSKKFSIALACISLMVVIFITLLNGSVRLYGAQYGNNILLFLIGGLSGTIMVYAFAQLLSKYNISPINVLSRGMIIILGFHNYFLIAYKIMLRDFRNPIIDYVISFLILLSFIPIIKMAERWMPALLGMRAKKTS